MIRTPARRTQASAVVLEQDAPGSAQRALDVTPVDNALAPAGRAPRTPRVHLIAGDLLALSLAWMLPLLTGADLDTSRRIACAIAAAIVTLLGMRRAGLYRSRVCALRSSEVLRMLGAAILGGGVFAGSSWLAGSVSGWSAAEGAAAATVLVLLHRWRFGRWLKHMRARGHYLRTVVLVGANEDSESLLRMLTDEPELGYRVAAVIGTPCASSLWDRLPRSDEAEHLVELSEQVGASGVIVVGTALGSTSCSAVVNRALAAGLHVQVWPGLHGLSSRRLLLVPASGLPFFYVEPQGVAKWQLAVKRAMDVALAILLCPFALPLLLAAGLWIKLDDGGPVIYRHEVVGRNGEPITVLKLRTMVPDASRFLPDLEALNECKGGPLFKASDDPRVTRAGRVLRATSIDELPQLWNVLNGTMSLVGPRFALLSEAAQFDDELQRRHQMRPGITGLWQSEARDNPSFSAYRRLDLFYVDNWSLSLDLMILANTAHAVSVRALRAVLPPVRHARRPAEAATEASAGRQVHEPTAGLATSE
jgi:exopolysaccharide biosynthesis polyprenyl glycosylphosphotransferase